MLCLLIGTSALDHANPGPADTYEPHQAHDEFMLGWATPPGDKYCASPVTGNAFQHLEQRGLLGLWPSYFSATAHLIIIVVVVVLRRFALLLVRVVSSGH